MEDKLQIAVNELQKEIENLKTVSQQLKQNIELLNKELDDSSDEDNAIVPMHVKDELSNDLITSRKNKHKSK